MAGLLATLVMHLTFAFSRFPYLEQPRQLREVCWLGEITRCLNESTTKICVARSTSFTGDYKVTPDLIESRNLPLVAELIVASAPLPKESRALHYTLDYPSRNDEHRRHDAVLREGGGQARWVSRRSVPQRN